MYMWTFEGEILNRWWVLGIFQTGFRDKPVCLHWIHSSSGDGPDFWSQTPESESFTLRWRRMSVSVSKITSNSPVCSTICLGEHQINIKARVTGPFDGNLLVTVESPPKGTVTRKVYPCHDVIIRWLSKSLWHVHFWSTGDTTVLHQAINLSTSFWLMYVLRPK